MILYKCKMCGGELDLQQNNNIAECPYCGTRQTVPIISDDKKARLYNRAVQYRLDNEFDKAYASYENIVTDKPDEAEAYWGMLLSEYGVEYVDDPSTGKKVPTCHRTLVRSVISSENYRLACQYADPESRIMYEDEAETLDILQKKILNASAKEEPYDVFICYKESDDLENRTPDSVLAQDIYDALTSKGLRVFFSRITLEDKLGQDYEPCIFAALSSSRVMLMVTTDSDHCNAVWVKNEWKRYLDFMKTDKNKVLIPVYRDISPYALPDEFSKLQAQDISKLGAIQDLVRGVEKIIGNKKGNQGGLNQNEKTLLTNLEKGQKRNKFILTFIGLYIVATIATLYIIEMFPGKKLICYGNDWDISLLGLYNTVGVLISLVPPLLPVIGISLNIAYGLRSTAANLLYTLLFDLMSIALIVMCITSVTPAALLLGTWAGIGVIAILTTLITHWNNKRTLKRRLCIIALLLVISSIMTFI